MKERSNTLGLIGLCVLLLFCLSVGSSLWQLLNDDAARISRQAMGELRRSAHAADSAESPTLTDIIGVFYSPARAEAQHGVRLD